MAGHSVGQPSAALGGRRVAQGSPAGSDAERCSARYRRLDPSGCRNGTRRFGRVNRSTRTVMATHAKIFRWTRDSRTSRLSDWTSPRPAQAGGDAGSSRGGQEVGHFRRVGAGPRHVTVFAMLRNTYPDRSVPVRNFRAPFIYQDPAKFDTALSRMVETTVGEHRTHEVGDLVRSRPRSHQPSPWPECTGGHQPLGQRPLPVLPLADRCLLAAAATATPDGAFHLVAPPHDEPDDSDATRLAERLTGLRWHRFDAHGGRLDIRRALRTVGHRPRPRSGTRQDRSQHQRTSGPGIRRADS